MGGWRWTYVRVDAADLRKGLQAECSDDCHQHSGNADHKMLIESPIAPLLYTCCTLNADISVSTLNTDIYSSMSDEDISVNTSDMFRSILQSSAILSLYLTKQCNTFL